MLLSGVLLFDVACCCLKSWRTVLTLLDAALSKLVSVKDVGVCLNSAFGGEQQDE